MVSIVRRSINEPLGIIQDFGWFGVVLFFLTSGFIISHVSLREDVSEFLVKRIFRIFPLLIIVTAFEMLRLRFMGEALSFGEFVGAVFLLNYLQVPQVVYIGVAWTLLVEVLFYAMVAMTMGLRSPHITILVNLSIVIVCIFFCRAFGDQFFLFSANCVYISILAAGQVIYFGAVARSIRSWHVIVYLMIIYFTFLQSINIIHSNFAPLENSYMISFIYCVFIFYIFTLLRDRFLSYWPVAKTSAISYTLYLTHGTFGLLVANTVYDSIGVHAAFLLGLVVTYFVSVYLNRWIEVPLNRLGAEMAKTMRNRSRFPGCQ